MSKSDILLQAFKDNLNNWTCGYCNSGSNQPAATFRDIKSKGYVFEEVGPSRWGKNIYCKICKIERTHYKLLFLEPQHSVKERINISVYARKRIKDIFDNRDAFTGASISSNAEVDHKIPWTRLTNDIDTNRLNDFELKQHFQLLTRDHNLLKDRACKVCKDTEKRPPLFGIHFWYVGSEKYIDTCEGCGWFDGNKWRIELNKRLQS